VFDVAGRVVNTLSKNVTETGINEVRWNGKAQDGRTLASGVYFYKIRFANGQESEAKMTLLK
jgi:flagellar hook assembly protein FlgD